LPYPVESSSLLPSCFLLFGLCSLPGLFASDCCCGLLLLNKAADHRCA